MREYTIHRNELDKTLGTRLINGSSFEFINDNTVLEAIKEAFVRTYHIEDNTVSICENEYAVVIDDEVASFDYYEEASEYMDEMKTDGHIYTLKKGFNSLNINQLQEMTQETETATEGYNLDDFDLDQLDSILTYMNVDHIPTYEAENSTMSDEAYREYLESLCFEWVTDEDIDNAIEDGELEL